MILFVFYNMLTGPRSYALWTLIYFLVSHHILNYGGIRLKSFAVILSVVLFVVAIAGGIRYAGLDGFNIDDMMIRFVNRIYMNPVNADRIIDAFEYQNIWKNSFLIELEVLLPGYQPDLGTILKHHVGAVFDGGGITVPLPAEGFMNYGYFGAAVYGVIFSFILILTGFVLSKVKNPFYRYMFAILLPLQFMGVVTMGISGIVVKTTIPTLFVFILMLVVKHVFYKLTVLKKSNLIY